MAIKKRQNKPAQSEINVTPLIDVVLVVLIIFMIATPVIIQEMAVNLPEKTQTVEHDDVPKQQLVAAVCEDGTFALNKALMPLPEMGREIKDRLRTRNPKVVFVDAHPEAPYERVVAMMDVVRTAGAAKIGMATLKEDDEFLACTKTPAMPAEGEAVVDATASP